jgi:hypothetical protein
LFGLVGVAVSEAVRQAAAEEEGRKVQSLGVRDPADVMAVVLMGALLKRFALQTPDAGKAQTRGTSAEELSDEYQHADVVLDVRTTRWGVSPTSATRYAIFYEGSLKLIDTRRRAIIAEGTCAVRPDHQPDDPSYDALMWNDATILKEKLPNVIQACVDHYRTRVLGLTMQDMGK